MPRATRLYIDLVTGCFAAALGVAALLGAAPSLVSLPRILPWLAFAAVAEGLVVVQQRRDAAGHMSFSATAHVAVALVFGPFAAAMVAALAVLVVDGGRRQPMRHVAINASTFGLSIGLGGITFDLVGGLSHGQVVAGCALVALIGVRFGANTLLYARVVSAAEGAAFLRLFVEELRTSAAAGIGEGCLGVLVGLAVLDGRWYALPFLLPLLAGLYAARSNYEQLRSETQAVLRTFVEVIDQRDPNTARHSERVTAYVDRFCDYVGVTEAQKRRLVDAARYHDLGKIVVDVSTLSKPGRLDPAELDAIRSHARVSARLLGPFHFAQEMARYVELHHERYDGHGYYGVAGDEVPIEAHVLIAADSFDAMTSKRVYRPALTHEEAADELRDKAGSQFHPLVARCFADMIDGRPASEGDEESAALRRLFEPSGRSRWVHFSVTLRRRSLLAAAVIPATLAVTSPVLRTPATAVAALAVAVYRLRLRSDRGSVSDSARGSDPTTTAPSSPEGEVDGLAASAATSVVVELDAFDRLRSAAGQLTAEGIVDDVERRLREALPDAAVVSRRGDDAFSITLAENGAVRDLADRVEQVIAATRLPVRAQPLVPCIRRQSPGPMRDRGEG
jgi:hypothetical protein